MAERSTSGKRRSPSPYDGGHRERKRVKLSSADIREMNREKLISRWKEQEAYIEQLVSKVDTCSVAELSRLKDSEAKLQLQVQDSTRRENILNMKLATKQQEMQDLMSQLHDLKQSQNTENAQLQSKLIDPAVNLVFQRMKTELAESKEKLEQAQNDLSAWKFTPDSVTGKKLMAKCRSLLQENQDLGRQISQGKVAQLEADIALQKKYSQEIKASLDELNEFVIQLDEEVEAMQSIILHLQNQLKEARDTLSKAGLLNKDRTAKSNGPLESHSSNSRVANRSQE